MSSTITIQEAIQYAQQAGFSGSALYTVVAVAIAESGLQTTIRGKSDPQDRGVLQINAKAHPEVSDSCAFDPACSFRSAYSISQGGKDFKEWCTYNLGCATPPNSNGPYKQYLAQVQAATQGLAPITPTTTTGTGGALDQIKAWGEYTAIFILAVFFILAGFYIMNQDKVNHAIQKVGDVAIKAAFV